MTRRLSLFLTIVGAALVLGVPTAGAIGVPTAGTVSEPIPVPRGLGVYPDSYKRTAVVGQPDPLHAFPGSRGAPSTTVHEPRSAPVATSSSNELAWSQIGIGFGIGIVLMLGLYLLVRGTRPPATRPLTTC